MACIGQPALRCHSEACPCLALRAALSASAPAFDRTSTATCSRWRTGCKKLHIRWYRRPSGLLTARTLLQTHPPRTLTELMCPTCPRTFWHSTATQFTLKSPKAISSIQRLCLCNLTTARLSSGIGLTFIHLHLQRLVYSKVCRAPT